MRTHILPLIIATYSMSSVANPVWRVAETESNISSKWNEVICQPGPGWQVCEPIFFEGCFYYQNGQGSSPYTPARNIYFHTRIESPDPKYGLGHVRVTNQAIGDPLSISPLHYSISRVGANPYIVERGFIPTSAHNNSQRTLSIEHNGVRYFAGELKNTVTNGKNVKDYELCIERL